MLSSKHLYFCDPKIRISGERNAAEDLMPALVEGFARTNQYAVSLNQLGLDQSSLIIYDDDIKVAEFAKFSGKLVIIVRFRFVIAKIFK